MASDILILGAGGQVGQEVHRATSILGSTSSCHRNQCDLSNIEQLREVISAEAPAIIINAAAYTKVDQAEDEPELADQINNIAVGIIGEEAKKLGALVVHYSTDYVFDGTKSSAYVEDDPVNPLSVYGHSKCSGEAALLASGADYLLFRTSWVFGLRGSNFLHTILRLAKERDNLGIVADQFGAPTGAELIADITAACIRTWMTGEDGRDGYRGIYHLAASGETTWHGFARYIVEHAAAQGISLKLQSDDIKPIATEEYPLPATRPANSRLETTKLRSTFGLTLPPWQDGVDRVIAALVR